MESYSVQAILTAVDKNFSSTMKSAQNETDGLQDNTKKFGTSITDIAKGMGIFKVLDAAVQTVTQSVGGAVNRFDTLNKYPTVMKALGYSTQEVDGSMQKLTKGIDGLPTSLDEIVSNTQQLAISTGSLNKGTDTALALNNAFLASGASTADASRGMQQYQQMLAKGTVDMQSWRTLQETMPIAMDKVAKSFKDQGVNSVTDLYSALQSGKITFDDFNNRLIELNDGVGGFADLAKKNSAGIKTSFQNIKTAVVKGLANVITAIDEGMQDAGLGSIAENFDKIKGAVNVAFKAITDSIPPAISFLTNLWNTIKPFLPLIMAVVGYISIYQGVMGTARKAVELYNGAQKMMNVLMNLNPIGLIIAAVIALVAGFIYLWNTSEEFRNFWIGLWDSIKNIVSTSVEWVRNVWDKFTSWLSETSNSISNNVKQAWNNLKQGTINLFNNTIQGAKNIWDSFKSWIINLITGAKDNIIQGWENLKQGTINTFNNLVNGAQEAWDNLVNAVSDTVDRVTDWFDNLKNIDLLAAGKAIMDSFLEGLQNAWKSVQDFVGGIGDWIREHKGPIRYDKKLLIPAGQAIMNGLNAGLTNGFASVQSNVGNMANMIADSFTRTPDIDLSANLKNANRNFTTQIEHSVNYGKNKRPAVFNIRLGNQVFEAFVEDISNIQGKEADINLLF
ncbi:tape measure protein [Enterococcus faecium]|nr:tape measure protein [Enterococcus lactis]EMF0407846.1 tape measure protein [Enterococcus faecium]MDQ8594599.1 tape measure protein [Enterococcus faecium]MDT2800364.1 tape measure protein [Enterococcus lactis]MDV4745638.1 tape measure protein [Enterococcus faecium]HAQ8094237.1 tape measure protein [Enterococcus faecium]